MFQGFNFSINIFGIFLFFALTLMFFVVWKEGRDDGFDTEKLFDLFLTGLVFGLVISRVFYAFNHALSSEEFFNHIYKVWIPGYNLLGGLLGFLAPVFIFSKLWNWSIFRLLDVFTLGSAVSLCVITLGYIAMQARFELFIALGIWLFLFTLLSKIRNSHIKSGYSFSIFLIVSAILKTVFFKNSNNLNFITALATLSLLVFIFRWRLANYDKKFITGVIKKINSEITRQKERIGKS